VGPGEGVGGKEHAEGQQLGQDEEPDRQVARRCGGGAGEAGAGTDAASIVGVSPGSVRLTLICPSSAGANDAAPSSFSILPRYYHFSYNNAQAETMRILLVDDSRAVASVIGARLTTIGHEVIVAENGEVAVALPGCPTDLLLMDIEMPVMNGFEAAERFVPSKPMKTVRGRRSSSLRPPIPRKIW
jgi:hypothetical protein